MSRIGKKPVVVPAGVTVDIQGRTVNIKGPKGTLSWEHHQCVDIANSDVGVTVEPRGKDKLARAMHGTARQLINNMVIGVTQGFEKKLDIIGVGYNAKLQGKKLTLSIGFCHPVDFDIPEGLNITCPSNTQILIQGSDKQQVGQFAAIVRRVRPPEPYKGKGIKYHDEIIRRKAAKSFGAG